MITTRQRIIATILLSGICVPAMAGEGSSDRAVAPHNISFFNAPGADDFGPADASPQGFSDYLFIAGSAFKARTSAQSVTYGGAGCINTDGAVTTDLQLPDGTEIAGVRTYYYNSGQPGVVYTFLTIYDGAGNLTDLLAAPSTLDSGYASEYFPLSSPVTVDNFPQSYVLTANTGAGLQLCGMRVYYAAP